MTTTQNTGTAPAASSTPAPQNNTPAASPAGMTPTVKPPIGDTLLAPLEGAAKSIAWLTNPTGGSKYICYAISLYCTLLSVESIYVAMPKALKLKGNGAVASQLRFVPKIGVDDNAKIEHLFNPAELVHVLENNFPALFPFAAKTKTPIAAMAIFDTNFWIALIIGFAIAALEARALRQVSIGTRIKRVNELKGYRVPDLDPDALEIAHIRAKEAKGAGVGKYMMTGFVVIGAYAVEIAGFACSVTSGNFWVNAINGFLAVFGSELFWSISQPAETDDSEAMDNTQGKSARRKRKRRRNGNKPQTQNP
jgi:hypothetical protein